MQNELGQQTGLRYGDDRVTGQIVLDGRSQVPSEIPELGVRVTFEFEQKTTAAKPLDEIKIEIREAGKPFRPAQTRGDEASFLERAIRRLIRPTCPPFNACRTLRGSR